MGMFKDSTPEPELPVEPAPVETGPQKKSTPTPSRKSAEAARRERMNPTLSPKQAKARQRADQSARREQAFETMENSPPRALMRDVVDSRINIGEFAMPVLLLVMVSTFLPGATAWIQFALYATWAFMALMVLDTWLMWRQYKKLMAERHVGGSTKGMLFYGFNRQLSFRRWRQPAPRVKRGERP